jgi:APA family basic amino acid/polyamine antiporter
LTGASLIVFRARDPEGPPGAAVRVPLHPATTALFVLACWAISATTIAQYPRNAGIGVGILLIGVFVYRFWQSGETGAASVTR